MDFQHLIDITIDFLKSNQYVHFIAVGFAVGLATRILMPGKDNMGIFATTLLGVAGSLLSGFAIQNYSFSIPISAPWDAYIASFFGAFLILTILKVVRNVG